MSQRDWTDLIVGERMELDQEFSETVAASTFSRQQWGLVMTAVEFEVADADDPEAARLVADTGNVESVLPEIQQMDGSRGNPVGPGAGSGSGSGPGGLLSGIKETLGLGGGPDGQEHLEAAQRLAQSYADELQRKLESRGKWEQVRTAASDAP